MNGRRRGVRGSDRARGSTLVELMVTVMILGIVVAATAALTIGFQRTTAQNVARQDQIDSARTAVEAVSKTIRTAVMPARFSAACGTFCEQDAFLTGSDFGVQFYGNLVNAGVFVGPSRVMYAVSTSGATTGQLIETIQIPDSPDPGTVGYVYCDATAAGATAACTARRTVRPVGFGILTTPGAPIFKYYDAAGNRLTPGAGGSLSATDLPNVLAVEIVVRAQSASATQVLPTTYIQRVMLPNAQAVIRQKKEAP